MHHRPLLALALTVTAGAVTAPPAAADDDATWASTDYNYASGLEHDFFDRQEWDLVSPYARPRGKADAKARAGAARTGKAKPGAATSTRIKLRKLALPADIADGIAADERAAYEGLYRELVGAYQQLAQAAGIPTDDVAGAVGTYLVSAYIVYTGTDLTEELLGTIVGQARTELTASPGFAGSSLADKQALYERSAFMAMYLTMIAQGTDTRASAKRAAKAALESYFKVDADHVTLGRAGFVVTE